MTTPAEHLDRVADVVATLRALGFTPVLVGGMALVVLGSRRVTRDFDFVLGAPGARLRQVVAALYDRGLELAARLDAAGQVTATIGNRRVAVSRLRIDAPPAGFFFNRQTGLRIDLLFDAAVPAASLAARATRLRVGAHVFHVASDEDLLRLKQRAAAARSLPGDAEDIAFLEARRRARRTGRLEER